MNIIITQNQWQLKIKLHRYHRNGIQLLKVLLTFIKANQVSLMILSLFEPVSPVLN